jgi:hypothetical protein
MEISGLEFPPPWPSTAAFGFEPMGAIAEVGRKLGRFQDVGWIVKALP